MEQYSQDNNVMPSMVVRQQRLQISGITSANSNNNNNKIMSKNNATHFQTTHQSGFINKPNPLPHLPSTTTTTTTTTIAPNGLQPISHSTTSSSIKAANDLSGLIQLQQQQQQQHQQLQQQQLFDQNGLVIPKRVFHHPASIQQQPIIRDLNRELKFNQVRGTNVLDKKSELKKAMEKLEENKKKKEAEQERLSRRTSLELRLEERAEKIAKETTSDQKTIGNFIPSKSNLVHPQAIGGKRVGAAGEGELVREHPTLESIGGGGHHHQQQQSSGNAIESNQLLLPSAIRKQASNFSIKSISR